MARFQADPSSESSSVNGDATPRTPPTPCPQVLGNGAYCGMSMLCTRCVESRELPDSNSNTKSGLFGQTKSDKPDSSSNVTSGLFGSNSNTKSRLFGLTKIDRPDSKSDAPAARSEASPCTGDIPLSEREWTFCTKCYSHDCPNAITTVGPPLCPTCRKPGCLGATRKPDSMLNPHWKFKSDYVPKSGSLFTSDSPNSDGLPKGDNPDFKALNAKCDDLCAGVDALGANFDALRAEVEGLHVYLKSEFKSMDSKFDAFIRNADDVVEKLKALELSGI
ncbi:unnamed protein product [Clonostachys byssicola]|uniref:Uncharacterized protein n=1 Tax=Clonostachys byssicola TaxID=160290 RepID=A0A9N9U044_9HYPO|nr:unnamed protein product [Clonostachys byssicola]